MNYTPQSHPDAAGHSGDEGAHEAAIGGPDPMLALILAAKGVEEQVEEALSELSLSMSKLTVLTKLVEAGEPLTLSEVAARLNCVRSNVTQLIDRLEADGLVRRVDDRADRRSIRAELTLEGRDRQAKGEAILTEVRAGFMRSLGAGDVDALVRILGRLG